jgi:hypothetical protein
MGKLGGVRMGIPVPEMSNSHACPGASQQNCAFRKDLII